MAQTGTIFASVTNSGAYAGRLVWIGSYTVQSQDPKTNTTVLRLYGTMHNTNSSYGSYNSYDCDFEVDGKVMGSGYMGFPNEWTQLGTKDVTITHTSTGAFPSTSFGIYADSYHFDGQSASGSVTAPALDRAAPTISTLTSSSVTASGFTFTATTNVNCNKWEYSLNNGSTWTTFSTTNGTSASKTLTGLNPATTYTVLVRVTKTLNDITATKTVSVATLGYATLTTTPNCNVDTATNITYDVKATGFYYKLFFYNGSSNIKTVTIGGGKSVGSNTQSVTIEGNLLPNATSATITARLITYTSSAYSSEVGRSEKTFTLSVPNSAPYLPTVAISLTPQNTNTWIRDTASYKYWGGFTAVNIALTPSAGSGATVSSYGVTSPSVTTISTGNYRTGVLGNGIQTIRATVTDSRGRTATASTTVTMATYSAPSVSSLSSTRGTYSGGTWTADENGNHIRVYSTPVCSLTNYGNAVTQTVSISGQSAPTQSGNYSYFTGTSGNSSYTVNVTLVDSTNTSSVFTLNVPSIAVPFNLNPLLPAAAFGKVAETTKALELAPDWRLAARGKYNMMDYYPYSFVAVGTSGSEGYARIATINLVGTWHYSLYQFTVMRIYDAVPINLYVCFAGTSSSDPALARFVCDAPYGASSNFEAFIYKRTTSTWDVYVRKYSAGDNITVYTHVSYQQQIRGTVTYADNLMTSVPSGATKATPYYLGLLTGTCTTAAATAAKVATVNGGMYFPLLVGTTICITFSNTNSAAVADLTLNVNSTGAYSIKMLRNGSIVNLPTAGALVANAPLLFTFSGSYWFLDNYDYNTNTTYDAMTQSEANTGTATTARSITAAVLDTKIKNVINAQVSTLEKDYVTERGTSGNWTYEKWNSGKAVCWGRHSHSVTSWATWGSIYESNGTQISYPSGLFTANPTLICSVESSNNGVFGPEMWNAGDKTKTPNMAALRPNSSSSTTVYFNIRAIGKWK